MDTRALEDIGLSAGEIKVYVALLELGPSSAGAILDRAGVQNSVFHLCVNRLVDKGLVSYIRKNRFRLYRAADPDSLLAYVRDKEKQLEDVILELRARQAFGEERQEAEIYEGMKGVMALLNLLIDDARPGDEFLFFAPELKRSEEIQKFYERYDIRRKDKGLLTKGIAPKALASLFRRRAYVDMKYTDMPVPANTGICNGRMAIVSWTEKPVGVLISSAHIVERQKEFFHALWDML